MAAVGQATGLPAQPDFSDHLFCMGGAHWTADKMFCDLGNLLKTNCRVQVQCRWTAGCPAKWGKSETAQAERMKRECISLCTVLCSHREFTHRQKHVCLVVICRRFYRHSLCVYWHISLLYVFVLVRVSTREHGNGLVGEDNLLLQI